ncbi:restriction endonuclease subunit S [Neptunomonas phycophila]|uniref:restriction endonuclease subunit S n=1 Tax=Neptunomonas phycophila TaxID=1572645 RepID=UPI0026E43A5F|nr:restriction endonuclease subunit S [Neptunomonas phycophila]MDO6783401.1 restriction endonuclease subunit S [Neptunomonas phycophila]
MSYEHVALGDIFKITSGGTPSRRKPEFYEGGKIHWIKTGDLHNKYIESASEFITQKGLNSSSTKLYPKGTVLIAMYGATIGACSILNMEACTNQACAAFVPNERVNNQYLYYCLKFNKDNFVRAGAGGAQPNISATFLKQYKIPLPSLPIQKQIATVLEKADTLRSQCQQMEQELNSLAQSVFLDMFGDPGLNPKQWPIKPIGETFEFLTDYHANGSYEILRSHVELLEEPDFALMVRTTDLEKNNFTEGVKYITKEAYDFLTKTKVHGNEIIVNKIGSAGKVYLMPILNRPVSLAMNQFMIRLNEKVVLPEFMYYLLTSKFGEREIHAHVKGAVTKTITKDALRSVELPIPPMSLQDDFVLALSKLNALKEEASNEVEKLDKLFSSLMQKAFKGELTLKDVA